ncbi:sufE-like protein 2, chloroplastic [Gastrolobium bilobum]|uniref:sufE-like protein 2, chloroplastic n=1 Tax=Gastrolobium bilobum TaxID=150636 RepID=UPI002AB2495A|nr:sufE-like protein 2, chloroplastic [Gastrolobium bilobum]
MVSSTATSATLLTLSHASPHLSPFSKLNTFTPKHTQLKFTATNNNNKNNNVVNVLCTSPSTSRFRLTASQTLSANVGGGVANKLNFLASEFGSLSEPIDRVKRLLHYAALLPPLEDSERVVENRVVGCSTQVWVVAEMDNVGRMRFRADSDSEISKGFCWCLVWMLDGAEPEEVLMVEKEDLIGMNVGLNVKTRSRVNTWHNVLFSMQKSTKDFILQMPMESTSIHRW